MMLLCSLGFLFITCHERVKSVSDLQLTIFCGFNNIYLSNARIYIVDFNTMMYCMYIKYFYKYNNKGKLI